MISLDAETKFSMTFFLVFGFLRIHHYMEVLVKAKVHLNKTYIHSEDVVAREIEGELIIVPLVSGIGDAEDELFTLNETGRAIWKKLDGKKTVKKVIEELSEEFEAPAGEIGKDVVGLVEELLKRRMLVEA
jgi:hypothetical protein